MQGLFNPGQDALSPRSRGDDAFYHCKLDFVWHLASDRRNGLAGQSIIRSSVRAPAPVDVVSPPRPPVNQKVLATAVGFHHAKKQLLPGAIG
jgi:hypothetical protein